MMMMMMMMMMKIEQNWLKLKDFAIKEICNN